VVIYRGRPVNGPADGIALVFQTFALPLARLCRDQKGGHILLSVGARHFADLDTQARKEVFARHLLASMPLAQHIRHVLDERPGHRAPRVRFDQELEDDLTDAAAEETLDAVVDWGRYAEIFAYDGQAEMFSLEDPEG
jgi:NitT/TauT family transport system ATP-binding protein